nr:collagen alpha-1(III) chain isoform X1 [Vanessa tameamea]
MRPPRVLGPTRLSILVLTLISYANSQTQERLLCKQPGTQNCFLWLFNLEGDRISTNGHITTNIPYNCGLTEKRFISSHGKFFKVRQIEKKTQLKKIFCNKVILVGRFFDWKEVENALDISTRVRRQSFTPRGRYRGQTQSQYLAIDRGNGKDEGRAEALSAADSSRASVSGNSGMGQAQSQSLYDPNCDDCYGKSNHEVENLKRPIGYKPGDIGYAPNSGSSWPTLTQNGGYNPTDGQRYMPGQNIPDELGLVQEPGLHGSNAKPGNRNVQSSGTEPNGPGTLGSNNYRPNGATGNGYYPYGNEGANFRPVPGNNGYLPNGSIDSRLPNRYDPNNGIDDRYRPNDGSGGFGPGRNPDYMGGNPQDLSGLGPNGANEKSNAPSIDSNGFRPSGSHAGGYIPNINAGTNRGPGVDNYNPNQGHRQGDIPTSPGNSVPQVGTYRPGQTPNQITQGESNNPKQVDSNFTPSVGNGVSGGTYPAVRTTGNPVGFGTGQSGTPNINWPIASGPYQVPGGNVYCCVIPNNGITGNMYPNNFEAVKGTPTIPYGTNMPEVSGGTNVPGGQYKPGGHYIPGTTGSTTVPGQFLLGNTGGPLAPGSQYGVNTYPSGQYIPTNTGNNIGMPGGQYVPGSTGDASVPRNQYGPGGTSVPGGQYSQGRSSGPSVPGGQYGPGGSIGSTVPGGQYGPGGNSGPSVPGGQYGPGGSSSSTLPGGQYGPGGSGDSTVPGGRYGPDGSSGPSIPGGQYGPSGSIGSTVPGGQYGPGGSSGPSVPGGQYGPGGSSGSTVPRGQYGPGGSSGSTVPGQYGPGGSSDPSAPGGQYGPGGSSGSTVPGGQYGPIGESGNTMPGGQYGPSGSRGSSVPGGQYIPTDTRGTGQYIPGNQYVPGATGNAGNTLIPGGHYATGGTVSPGGQYGKGNAYPGSGMNQSKTPQGFYNQGVPTGPNTDYNGVPQNYLDPNTVAADGDDSEAEANVAQNINGTTASASSKGGNDKGRAQTSVQGTYTGSGSFQAQAQITGENKEAQSEVSGGKKGASSSASGSGKNNKSQANVQLGSETGSVQTQSQSNGVMHSSNSQVQGSVKGGMADAQARGPGSTSSQAQIGFTPYKDEDKSRHDLQRIPFTGGGMASAQSSGRTGQSQSQLHGTFKYGITYNGAAQSGASLDKDAVFPNRLSFEKIDVFDEKEKNINVDKINMDITETPQSLDYEPPILGSSTLSESSSIKENVEMPTTENVIDESMKNSESRYASHPHTDHHTPDSDNTTYSNGPTLLGSRRSFKTNYGSMPDYEFTTDKDETQPEYDTDVGYEGDGNEASDVEQNEYSNYDEYSRDSPTHQYLQNTNRKGLEVQQTTGGNTQHIILGALKDQNAEIIQRDTERPDENRVYQPGERVPGTGGYTIPVGFTGSVKSVASKDKTYVVGSKDFPSQAQTVTLTPGKGKIKYTHPSTYGKYVKPKNLRSLQSSKENDNNRYVSVSKSVTRALDSDNNIRKQYSHTYYTKSSSCGYFTFTCTMVSSAEGRKKVCKPKMPTNPDGTPIRC